LPAGEVEDSIIMTCGPPKLKDSITEILGGMQYTNGFVFN